MSVRLQLRDIFSQDLDKLFSYRTPMLVLIKDRTLGLMAIFINLCILIYFVVYVIIIQKAYLAEEYSRGSALMYVTGTAISRDGKNVRVWDGVDVIYPHFDPSATVISTEIKEDIRQEKGVCADSKRKCMSAEDCIKGGECIEGLCKEASWCTEIPSKTYDLVGVENFIFWFQGSINFITTGIKMSTLGVNKAKVYPDSGANSYLLSDILKISGLRYEDIKKTGAVLKIVLDWNCDVTWTDNCDPKVKAERIDHLTGRPMGFQYDRYFYYKENGVQYRDHQDITGIKIIVECSGRAYAVTMQSIILNVSSAINLTMITPRIVNFLMIWVLANRNVYKKLKYVVTKDLNEESGNSVRPSGGSEPEGRIGGKPKNSEEANDVNPEEHFANLP